MNNEDQIELANPYAKKYMSNKNRIVIKDNITEKIRKLKLKNDFCSDNETIEYLCDLEEKVDPVFKHKHECKTCHETVKIPKDINVNKFVHKDLCTTTDCKGYIIKKKELVLDENGIVLGAKNIEDYKKRLEEFKKKRLEQSEQTDANDEQSEQTDTNDEQTETDYKDLSEETKKWAKENI